MSEAQREYRRSLALYCLTREQAPVTAADLAISMQATAQAEGHARNLWGWLDGVCVGGVLRTLAKQGVAEVHSHVRDTSAGRDVPRWRSLVAERTPMPAPPQTAADIRAIQQAVADLPSDVRRAEPTEGLTEAALRLLAHQAEFIARFVEATQAPEVANDD